MTETEWNASTNPAAMLTLVRNPGDRKLRLLGLQILRNDLPHLRRYPAECFVRSDGTDLLVALEAAIGPAEACADGAADERMRRRSLDVVNEAKEWAVLAQNFELAAYYRDFATLFRSRLLATNEFPRFSWGDGAVANAVPRRWWPFSRRDAAEPTRAAIREERCARNAALIRDIFGNPFRPAAFDPAWRTDTAVSLARGMYESRDFSPMPILADALQDAGCDAPDVLNHCRDEALAHVRGCWVVDLVLGKT